MLGTIFKQPADQLDYDIDFSKWLPEGDLITTVTAEVDPADTELVVLSAGVSEADVKVWLGGGRDGSTYKVTVVVATTGGRIKEVDFKVRVRDC